MPTLRIEHAIHDFDTWRAAFERDPADRQGSGVTRYSIHRPTDDPHYVMIDLDFESADEAEGMLERLQEVWRSPAAAPALKGKATARIVDTVETFPRLRESG